MTLQLGFMGLYSLYPSCHLNPLMTHSFGEEKGRIRPQLFLLRQTISKQYKATAFRVNTDNYFPP